MNKIKKSKTAKSSERKKAKVETGTTIKNKIVRKKSPAKKIVSKKRVAKKKKASKGPKDLWKAFSNGQNQYISPKWETFAQANSRALSHMGLFEDVSLHHNFGSALDLIVLWKAYCLSEGKYISTQWEVRQQADQDAQPHINAGHHVRFDRRIAG